jgi:hypothetical protein
MLRTLLNSFLALSLFTTGLGAQQFPPARLENLKAYPADMPVRALVDSMAGFTRALGVRCTYCHVGQEGQPLESYNFTSDEKSTKVKAREMIRLVAAINNDHLSRLPDRKEPRMVVNCATCHRGVTEPRPLQQLLLTVYDGFGADSAEAVYRRLRQRYYGAAAYDFGEVALADVATAIRRRGQPADGLRFNLINTELLPNSGFAHRQTAEAHVALGDTAAAVVSLQRALTINSNDTQAQQRLAALRRRAPQHN